jgi:hypothetical protein
MKLVEEPEPDFDLEAELPAELAALAEQLTADANFLSEKFPARQPHAWHSSEPSKPAADVAQLRSKSRGARWWLRAAAIVLVLTSLPAVLGHRNEELGSCPISAEAIDRAADESASATPDVPPRIANGPTARGRIALAGEEAIVADSASTAKLYRTAALMPEHTFHSFTSAQQEALLDLTPAAQGASVDF